ncbi:hypothetical protein E1B28_003075 [Marasmius oreades]|uniref:Uncharacterized protein n=1 Tax=Marasmius oreades TaxID=181124 RepID=A0A9P7RL37_9AGAR|nr:uncharacterized protein E1B28_003075 [Marasmius oreades]KAG7085515.1 hypothetical protein E1B28_003075 [Marasmius oreades]
MALAAKQVSAQLTSISEQLKAIAHGHTTSSTVASPAANALFASLASSFSPFISSTPSDHFTAPSFTNPPLPHELRLTEYPSVCPILPPTFPTPLYLSTQPLPPTPAASPLTIESLQPPTTNVTLNSKAETLTHLNLQDGTTLSFRQSDVPDPRNLTFATDIDLLGILWTESNPKFREDLCEVKINGHGIALEHWPTVFKKTTRGGEDRHWEGLKKIWDKWRWVGLRYNQSTPANFWAEFTDGQGKQMNITTIYRILLEQRKAAKAK